jgi:translocation and assembly module TamA
MAAARTVFRVARDNTAWSIERLLAGCAAAALLVTGPAVLAQPRDSDSELERLIPDSALDNPEDFARSEIPDDAPPVLDPASPLADLPGLDLPWPDEDFEIPTFVSLEPEPEAAEALADVGDLSERQVAMGDMVRISDQLTLTFPADPALFPERDAFIERFEGLSTLESLDGDADNPGQIGVRARTDRELLERLLRIYGYYDGDVRQTVGGLDLAEPDASEIEVRFNIVPGPRYSFGQVALPGLETTGPDYPMLRDSFGIDSGDPLYADEIVLGQGALDLALGENGYPFAELGEPDLLVDHAREEGDLTLPVTPGGKYVFGQVDSELEKFLSSKHLQRIARFEPGDIYQRSLRDDLRRAILATGLVSSVSVTPTEVRAPTADQPGVVEMDVAMTQAPLRTVSGLLGYDSTDGFRIEAAWEHRNLFPPEGMLRVRGIAGTKEQLAGVTFRKNNFKGRDQILTVDLFARTTKRDAFQARTASFVASFEKLTTLLFQKPWTWSVGLEATATNEREGTVNDVDTPRQTYFVGALPLRAEFDGTDDLLDPTRGFRVGLRASPEVSRTQGRTSTYVRVRADASYYQPVGDKVVLAGRVRLGSIPGAEIVDIAPSRRFYAGGGGSVRGYGYQKIGPRNSLNEPSGGRSLYEFSLEARVATGLFDGNLSVVPFVDAGGVDEGVFPSFSDVRMGAGIGLRYKTGFGPLRLDIATPLNPRPGDARVAVYVALGQAF